MNEAQKPTSAQDRPSVPASRLRRVRCGRYMTLSCRVWPRMWTPRSGAASSRSRDSSTKPGPAISARQLAALAQEVRVMGTKMTAAREEP